MSTEKTWVTVSNFTVYTGSSYLNCGQEIMYQLKNHLVASGGWTVYGSSDGVANYEYTGVTAGGSYGGGSTGPYDVWADSGDARRAADGSGPGWVLLKGPTSEGWTPYLVLAMEGTSDSLDNGYIALCADPFQLHATSPLLYLPSVPEGSSSGSISRKTFYTMYSGTYTTRGYLSMCPEDGSFAFALNLTIRTFYTNMIMCGKVDPISTSPDYLPYAIGMGGDNGFGTYYKYFAVVSGEYSQPEYQIYASYARPYRYNNTDVLVTDLPTVDCDGEVPLFPFYVCHPFKRVTEEQAASLFGRLQDFWIAPTGLADGDSVPSASTEYFKCGYWMFPGTAVPVVGP